MSCILRVSGENFDVDVFLKTCTQKPVCVYRKDEPRSKTSRQLNSRSGVNFSLSEAEFSDLSAQIRDVQHYLAENSGFIHSLKALHGIDAMSVDFGVAVHPPSFSSFTLPSDLLGALGAFGIDLILSVYPRDDDTKTHGVNSHEKQDPLTDGR